MMSSHRLSFFATHTDGYAGQSIHPILASTVRPRNVFLIDVGAQDEIRYLCGDSVLIVETEVADRHLERRILDRVL
jgi:hypothetical protein